MPSTRNGTVQERTPRPALRVVGDPAMPPLRRRNSEVRSREYLTPAEVDMLCKAARERRRYGHRDATMILIAYRHGLRVSELVALRWDQVDFPQGRLHVNRAKTDSRISGKIDRGGHRRFTGVGETPSLQSSFGGNVIGGRLDAMEADWRA
jgi:integrase